MNAFAYFEKKNRVKILTFLVHLGGKNESS